MAESHAWRSAYLDMFENKIRFAARVTSVICCVVSTLPEASGYDLGATGGGLRVIMNVTARVNISNQLRGHRGLTAHRACGSGGMHNWHIYG